MVFLQIEEKVNNKHVLKSLRISGGFLAPTPRAQFRISGGDRTRYLNSQLSNDLYKAIPGTALPSCLLTTKGKICAMVWVFEQKDAWQIDADWEVRTALHTRLERYIVADDVQVEDISDNNTLFHIFGEAASKIVAEGPSNSRLGIPGKDVWIPQNQTEKFYKNLIGTGAFEITQEVATLLRIAQGIPAWGYEISEDTFPAEVGLDHFAVDFSKGCYVGQEIVSRIRSVGRVPRRLVGFVTQNAEDVLFPNSKVIDPVSKTSVGTLTSTAFHFEHSRAVALGYLKSGIDLSPGIFLAIHPESGEETPLQLSKFPLYS